MRPLGPALLLLAVSALAQAPAAPPPPDTVGPRARILPAPEGHKFFAGQTLVYDVEWRLWRAGTATIRLEPAGPEQRIYATADSTGFVALLYRVHDTFETFFDAKTLCSRQITKKIEEGSRKRETTIRFDAQRGKAILDEKDLKTGKTKHAENDTPPCATDVLSGVFYAAAQPLPMQSSYTFPLNDGAKTVEVTVNVEAREKVKTPAGEFNAIRVQPESSMGLMKNKGKVWIWYSDDAQRLPVQMRSKMFWGTLTFRLARIEKDKK
jgi:hypothetical protein